MTGNSVVEDSKYQDARGPAYPTFFLPFLQSKDPKASPEGAHFMGDIELRVAENAENLNAAVRRTLAGIDPNLTVLDLMSMNEQVARNFNQDRLIARLTSLFGLLALVLASVGLYGVMSYFVARRTSEIGIRMALGAARSNVVAMVLRGALWQIAVGLAIGVPAALFTGRLMASLLYGVGAYDPMAFLGAAAVLAGCATVADLIPARRAASIEPMLALRRE